MTLELARRLLATGAIAARDVEAALYLSVVRGVSIARALVDRGVLGERALEEELSRRAGLPLRQVNPAPDIVAKLPRGMCRMLAAVPLRYDSTSGVIELAAVDPLDGHVANEFTFHLGSPIRVQRATMSSIEEAIRRLELAEGGTSSRSRRRTPAFPHGAPDTVPPSRPPSQPPAEEVPIPLVRRVSHPHGADAGAGQEGYASEPSFVTEAEDLETTMPFRRSGAPDPEAIDEGAFAEPVDNLPTLHTDLALPLEPASEPPPPPSRRRAFRSAPDVPSISFPSAPPPAPDAFDGEDERTLVRRSDGTSQRRRPASDHAPTRRVTPPPRPPAEALRPPIDNVNARPPVDDERTPIDADAPSHDGPEPETIPRTPDAGWTPTLPELLDLIGRARVRDDLLDLVLRAVTLVAQRAALFVVKREGFTGWSCNPAFGPEEDLRTVVIPSAQPSIFATSSATGFYLGPIPQTPVHAALLRVLGRASPDVAVYVAKAKGRATIVMVADQLDDTLLGTRALGEIASRAGEALTQILSQR